MRFRHVFIGVGGFLTLLLLLLTDVDGGLVQKLPFGAGTVTTIIVLTSSILYIALLHIARKGLFDYIDVEAIFKKAMLSPEGAGMFFIGLGLMMISVSMVILAATK